MSFPRYEQYKDSGVEWVGDVPQHWEISPYKRLVDIQNGLDHKHVETDEGYPVLGSGAGGDTAFCGCGAMVFESHIAMTCAIAVQVGPVAYQRLCPRSPRSPLPAVPLGWEMGRAWQNDEKVRDFQIARRHARAVAATAGAAARSIPDWEIGVDT